MSELSTRVRLRREELGLSQEQLAQRMGYRSKSSITKLEKGVNDIPQAKLEELAAALETTPAYLLGLDVLCPPPGFEPLPAMAMVPLVGSIACGTPITAEHRRQIFGFVQFELGLPLQFAVQRALADVQRAGHMPQLVAAVADVFFDQSGIGHVLRSFFVGFTSFNNLWL